MKKDKERKGGITWNVSKFVYVELDLGKQINESPSNTMLVKLNYGSVSLQNRHNIILAAEKKKKGEEKKGEK